MKTHRAPRRLAAILPAAALLLFAAPAVADVVVLKDGTRITGTIVSLVDGKMTVNSPAVGEVKVDVAEVDTFGSTEPLDLRLTDGSAVSRTVDEQVAGSGRVALEPNLLMPGQTLGVADVKQINPPAAALTGSIAAGGLFVRGNTQTDSLNLNVALAYTTEQDKVTFAGSYLYGRTRDRATGVETSTADNWQIEARNDYSITKPLYFFADLQLRKDRISDLDLRVVPSGGLGYIFVNDPNDVTFSTEAGIAWVYEQYTNATPTREDVSLHLAYHLTKKFNDKVSVFHDLEYLPSVENGRNFIVNTDLGVHAKLTKHFFTEAKVTLDFDSRPANGAEKTNVFYSIGVGYTF